MKGLESLILEMLRFYPTLFSGSTVNSSFEISGKMTLPKEQHMETIPLWGVHLWRSFPILLLLIALYNE